MILLWPCDKVGETAMGDFSTSLKIPGCKSRDKLRSFMKVLAWPNAYLAGAIVLGLFSLPVCAQQVEPPTPVVVQPGAPGQPTRTLPPSTRATLPPLSPADVKFMQGMIMHHAQAVEMTALIESHTQNKELHLLGARIGKSQSDEINFMKRWLMARGEAVTPAMLAMTGMDMSSHSMAGMDMPSHAGHSMLMPGMLTAKQMLALKKAKGAQFDHLFLTGMIQHHGGALIMVKDLFDTAGAGQDAELFNFTTDVDSGQRAEIRIMQSMLGKL
jgi:uncharacterized protein (DUF305 family)